ATLLSLSPASTPSASVFNYAWHWHTEEIIPLSANIQWIIYSNGSSYLVKVLLNEKEMVLPIPSAPGPYYDWSDFRKFYLDKLKSCKASPHMNMLDYLKTVKN
ncbi:MAG TPA: hypothetical protein VK622_11060, partial [Puia sp.]|nr:hypothetical protein [Puia sp.]